MSTQLEKILGWVGEDRQLGGCNDNTTVKPIKMCWGGVCPYVAITANG
ncbi:hypothetical protein ADU37_CDS07180 [Thermococcus sp. 2319x1]|nr:hypothetical protein ADU37_CDS07180 [Thermococcus sp. 2319x1]